MYQYVLFDLDGTLTDPKEGITKSVQYALSGFGTEEPDLDKLEPFIGPPLRDSFREFYGIDGADTEKAVALFRERFETKGIFENEIYPGMAQMLRELSGRGILLAIASSKPQEFVHIVLRNFGIEDCFCVIVGSEKDGTRDTKTEVMEEALAKLRKRAGRAFAPEKVLMVGDRKFDIEGARHFGVDSAAVTYGYAPDGELEACGPDYMAGSVEELWEIITQEKHYMRYAGKTPFSKPFEILLPLLLYWAVELIVFNGLYFLLAKANVVTQETSLRIQVYLNAVAAVATWPMLFSFYKKSHMADTSHVVTRHKKQKWKREWVLVCAYAVSLSVGLNMLISFMRLVNYSDGYGKVASVQYSVDLLAGLLIYGLLMPFTEEVLFRGVMYNRIRMYFPVSAAMVLSGLIFGCYHGNIVQIVYATLMGCAMALLYEYYGLLAAPVLFHCSANSIVYLLTKSSAFANAGGGLFCGLVLFALALGLTCFYVRCYQCKRNRLKK